MRALTLGAAVLLAGAGAGLAQDLAPAFRLPLEFPAAQTQAVVSRIDSGVDTNWIPIAVLAELPAGVLGRDPSGAVNPVSVPAGTRWVSAGVEDGALLLTSCTQRVTASIRPELDGQASGTNGSPFTISAWAWMKDATWFTVADKGDGREWLFGFDRQDRLGFTLTGSDPKSSWSLYSDPLTGDEKDWHHYGAVVENTGATPTVTLFRDGVPLAGQVETTNGFTGLKRANGGLSIGSAGQMRARSQGLLGGLEIWNRALSAPVVKDVYATGAKALGSRGPVAASLPVVFPGAREIELWSAIPWSRAEALRVTVSLPAEAPTNCEALVYVKDWDWLWYQHLVPGCLVPGVSTQLVISVAPESESWAPVGHQQRWNFRCLAEPKNIGVRVFCKDSAWTGRVEVASPEMRLRPDVVPPPFIRDVRPSAGTVPKDEKFEVSFRIPDRHLDPFDAAVVRVTGVFTAPDGSTAEVDGFYANDFYREVTLAGERITPQGGPVWRIRYAPRQEGVYTYSIRVKDAGGEAGWGPGRFTVTPAVGSGFVRVSKKDPRFFEFTDGSPYFPIGHNIRSTFDTRHDGAFPWEQRFDTGTALYGKYFEAMAAAGEQMAEVWFAPWSLGLEWDERWAGYHGVGQYNMQHAWEMDRVMDEASRRGIMLNVVIHNHGKFSLFSDREYLENPFNADNGGYLQTPEAYFDDPRAMESFRKLMRYTIARWGYSRQVFAWELWSEFDLVGTKDGFYKKPVCVEWHRQMGRYVKEVDPNQHLVSSHVCGDYRHQDPNLVSLPEMDHAPVDAYHGNSDPVYIVQLMKETAQSNNLYNKPVLITEFGGSAQAADMAHLRATLHAGLWASTAIPVAGTPMFWWWMAIDEENLYPLFRGPARFMKEVDRRDPELVPVDPFFSGGGVPAGDLGWACLRSPRLVLGWVCRVPEFQTADLAGPPRVQELKVEVGGLTNGLFTVEYWDTAKGEVSGRQRAATTNGLLSLTLPPFVRDAAFQARLAGP